MILPGDLVLLISPKGKRYLHKFEPAGSVHSHDGRIMMAEIAAAGYGRAVRTHLGLSYLVLRPTIHDLITHARRQGQIMFPKEIGYLLLKMGIGPGSSVIECGTGSGGLALALAWYVGETGRVLSYDRREEFQAVAKKNLDRVGLTGRVEFVARDINEGFVHADADALFLDVRTPWEYLAHVPAAVKPGAMLGFLLPTTNQVSELLRGLDAGPFDGIEVLEILIRHYKPVAERLRPADRMIAHTGFLVFARHMLDPLPRPKPEAEPESEPEG